jgi:hypothetical protein
MIEMSDSIAPISAGMELPLPFVPVGSESIVPERVFHDGAPQNELPQWEQFEEYPQSLVSVAKSLGDGIEQNPTAAGSMGSAQEDRSFGKMTALNDGFVASPFARTEERAAEKGFGDQSAKVVASPSDQIQVSARQETGAAGSSRFGDQNSVLAQEGKSPVAEASEETDVSGQDDVLVRNADDVNVRAFESLPLQVGERFDGHGFERMEVQSVGAVIVRMSENGHVQTPAGVNISHLVDTVAATVAATPAFSAGGEGELRIQLKPDVLDGSSIKIEVKGGELKIVVMPASRAAEEVLVKSQETFQHQLAERVTAWRINVGVAAFDLRNHGRSRLEDEV